MRQVGNVLRIPADVNELATVRAFIRDQTRRAGADQRTIDDVVQAVDESVTNTIVHGYRGAQGMVEVEVEASGKGELVVRLRDEAPEFDPTRMPGPDPGLPLEVPKPTGMGIFLAREMTDEVRYRRTALGNELTLVKLYSDTRSAAT